MPEPVTEADLRVAHQLRLLRKRRGITLMRLAETLGVSYQAVQHYEAGQARIAAGRLVEIARVLDVPVAALFGDEDAASGGPERNPQEAELLSALKRLPSQKRRLLVQVA